MMAKENARPAGGTAGAGQSGTATGKAHNSFNDFTTPAPQRQRLSDYLGRGKYSAVTGQQLAERTGLSDLRELTRLVEKERSAGVQVCATCDSQNPGYFLASGPEELAAYIKSLDRRLHNVRRTRDLLADTLEEMTGQGRLF